MDDDTKAYLRSLRESKRWNIDLSPLLANGLDVAGIVLHDEFSALREARHKLEEMDNIEIYETDSTKRFRGMIVDLRLNRLVESVRISFVIGFPSATWS